MKLVGPLIRVINYGYSVERKEKIIDILHTVQERKMDVGCFSSQLQFCYLRMIENYSEQLDLVKKICKNMCGLLQFTKKRDLFLHEVQQRFKEKSSPKAKEAYLAVILNYIKDD